MIAQIGIFLFGIGAIFLVNDHRPELRKWGPIVGLVGQPFWFMATIASEQWGMVAICAVYTLLWMRGIYNSWLRPA